MMGRHFSHRQKQALYWVSHGKCEKCGLLLPEGWHADHIQPYVAGGPTDVSNGQALCASCNLKKGSKTMMRQWPNSISLRRWQDEFLTNYHAQGKEKENFLLVATPGAGKTTASLKVAYDLLRSGTERIIIVCPSDNLRTQWLNEATKVGVDLDKKTIGFSREIMQTADYVGLVVTYAEVASNPDIFRAFVRKYETMVILDEIHHCGDHETLAWGEAIKKSFEFAKHRLLLSGTPFRSDNNPIPFVPYERDASNPRFRKSKADHSYGYGDALKDGGVVRHIIFSGWDGEFAWSDSFWGEERKASFQSLLNKSDASRRLRTAISPNESFMRKMLEAASQKLDEVRGDGHNDAGGLVVAENQESAKALAKTLHEITGEKPVLVVSEMGELASDEIKKFREGKQKWIVAVRMVSEGVDIKRLRVGVYATNIKTDTFFRQVIGRVIRWDSRWNDLYDQTAYFYIPEDPELLRLAKAIKEEIDHYIEEQEETEKKSKRTEAGTAQSIQVTMSGEYEILYSEGNEKHHHTSGLSFDMEEVDAAKERFRNIPGFEMMPGATLALALRELGVTGQLQPTVAQHFDEVSPTPVYELNKSLKQTVQKRIGQFVFLCHQKGIILPSGNIHQVINSIWGQSRKFSRESTNNELEDKLKWIEGLIDRVRKGDKSILSELR